MEPGKKIVKLPRRVRWPGRPPPSGGAMGLSGLRGESPPMRALFAQIRKVAPTDLNVLIIGESGTGKEAVAQALHAESARGGGPFVPVNCGAIAPALIEAELLGHEKGSFTGAQRRRRGYFERAHGGTLFLDEIGELPLDMQVKLLRVLESRRFYRVGGSEPLNVDVRVIAASNRDLQHAVQRGEFRDDLLYRLAAFPLRVPPLRDRAADIVPLAEEFLAELNARERAHKSFAPRYLHELEQQTWPGNVRELKHLVQRAYILAGSVIDAPLGGAPPAQLPPARDLAPAPAPAGQISGQISIQIGTRLADAQRALILATLSHAAGDKRRTARLLGISLKTLYNRLEAYRPREAAVLH